MRQHVAPMVVTTAAAKSRASTLDRVELTDPAYGGEGWLQDLVSANPDILPIDEIEPAFATPVTICTELPVATGAVDLFMVNSQGFPVVVETKLWANPEARRQVVAQTLDYARCLAEADVTGIERTVRRRRPNASSLYDLVAAEAEGLAPDRAAFYDAFASNLAGGRFLILLVGDGIRREVEALTDFLRTHVRLDFTFGLIELPAYRMPEDDRVLVTPRVVARTVDIERASTPTDSAQGPQRSEQASTRARRTTVSEQRFLELLEDSEPGLGGQLREFLDAAKERGIEIRSGTSRAGSLQLYWTPQEGRTINFGVLKGDGFWEDGFHFFSGYEQKKRYMKQIADLFGGYVEAKNKESVVRGPSGGQPRLKQLLAQRDDWLAIIDEHIEMGQKQLEESSMASSSS